jgi:predicted HAD superfamily Cof-like phosphohydrolase
LICFTIAVDTDEPAEVVREEILKKLGTLNPQVWRGFRSENADVSAFHRKFGLVRPASPHFLPTHALEFRLKFLREEITEFEDAHRAADMHGAADSLVDEVYVCHGTADMMGIPWYAIWAEVQRKNLLKRRASSVGESKRGSTLDVVKPEGWTPPDHTPALGTGPWPTLDY